MDNDGNVTQWNRQTEKITGLSFEDVRNRPLASVFPRLSDEMANIRDSISRRCVIHNSKIERREEKDIRFEDVTVFPLVANGVKGAVIRVDDVTEQVRLEEMMIQSEKMLSVGGLAAGMAHEINNPLAGIMQTARVMANRLGDSLDIPANRKAAEAAGATINRITNYLLLAFMLISTIMYCFFIYLGMGLYVSFLESQGITAFSNFTAVTSISPFVRQLLAVASLVLNSIFALFSSRNQGESNSFVTAAVFHISWLFSCLLAHGIGCLLPFFMWTPVLK